mgnify:CR=1 FL=1
MSPLLIAALGLLMVATAFLSGLFGMAGGLILIGVLLTILPLPSAMVLHAITQMASNGWRAFLWRDAYPLAAGLRLSDRMRAGARRLVDHALCAGQADRAAAARRHAVHGAADAEEPASRTPTASAQGSFYGFICMGLMLMTGVSGPLMDTFFLGGNFGRREVVATKATCQVASHFVKLIYFGGIIDQAATLDPVLAAVAVAASMLGTTLARRILEAMSDAQFRTWANRLITTVACYYIGYGSWLLLLSPHFRT